MSAVGSHPANLRAARLRGALAVVSLGILIFSLHARALGYGLFMDDHAHFQQLRECDWSLSGLTDACRLELVGGVAELWWMPEFTLRFFRPVAFGLMKLTYTLVDWNPAAMHAASLLWHWVVCALLLRLLRRLGASLALSWCVAALFALHPAHVATVQWIAVQSELMVTTFLLSATLCYARFRGWPESETSAEREIEVSAPAHQGFTEGRGTRGWAAASAAFFALALGCRENAIVYPLVILALEPFVTRRRGRPVVLLHVVFWGTALLYLAARWHFLEGAALPPRPYMIPPGAPDFPRYVADKTCYYLLGEFFAVPCVPIGGLPYFRARPLVFYGLALAVAALLVALCVRYRRRFPGLIGPVWLLGTMTPVLPAFESPHHLYLPGIGWAVCAMLVLRGMLGADAPQPKAGRSIRRPAVWAGTGLSLIVFGAATHFYGLALETGHRVERRVVEEVLAAPSGLRDGDTLYMANLPIIAHYLGPAVEQASGLRDLRVVPLTWAPRVLRVETPAELTWVDARTIDVRVAHDRFFAGSFGQLVAQATGRPSAIERDSPIRFAEFRVELMQRDEQGIEMLRFTFDEPPTRPGSHLFWGSTRRWAAEVKPPKARDE